MFDLIALRFGALLGAALVGVALGLAVSALVNTPTQSVMWVPLILIPQILFGSFVVIIPEMNDAVLRFSEALPSFNLERIMDVGLIYGRATPRMTNQTKIPAFIDSPDKQDVVDWDGKETRYDRVSEVNKSWQNLIVLRDVLGAREKKLGVSGDPKDSVEERADVRLSHKDQNYFQQPRPRRDLRLGARLLGDRLLRSSRLRALPPTDRQMNRISPPPSPSAL